MEILSLLEKKCPPRLWDVGKGAGEVAWGRGMALFLVGGAVRDVLLGRPSLDLDLVAEGPALELLSFLGWEGARTYPRFGTAKLEGRGWTLDLASARREVYPRPGALPRVTQGSLNEDLRRRDFTINAMAVALAPPSLGELVDPFDGRADLEAGLLRVLHPKSFQDDATRMLRGVRYAGRFGFRLEGETERLLRRDLAYLDAISGDRLRRELGHILREEEPERALALSGELGVLGRLSPGLQGDGWLGEKFAQARWHHSPDPDLYLALLAYRLPAEQLEGFLRRLNFPKGEARLLRDTHELQQQIPLLPQLGPSQLYELLKGRSSIAIWACALATDSLAAREKLLLFLKKWRYVKLSLRGEDLFRLGVAPGPTVGEFLRRLKEARLEGKVRDRRGEVRLVEEWLGASGPILKD